MNKRRAFTLVEIIIAMFLMMIVMLSFFMLNQSSTKSSMDAYYEMLAFSLAREPIEVFRGFGYDVVKGIYDKSIPCPKPYEIDKETKIEFNPNVDLQYPADAENFTRYIHLEEVNDKCINITVTVSPKGQSKAESWLRKDKQVILESNVTKCIKW